MSSPSILEDDTEWLQISDDDDDGDDEEHRKGGCFRANLSLNIAKPSIFDNSYTFTASRKRLWLNGLNTSILTSSPTDESLFYQHRFVYIHEIGRGACGVVFKALDLANWKLVAIKKTHIHKRQIRRQLAKELVAYQTISSHKNLVGFIDSYVDPNDESVGLIVEYVNGGNLQHLVDSGGCQDESILSHLTRQCLMGLDKIHNDHTQIHRDIKPANLLISDKGSVRTKSNLFSVIFFE